MDPDDIVCDVLNKLFWKCRCPEHLDGDINEWAAVWLGEIREIPNISNAVFKIRWDPVDALFYTSNHP